ncbi:MAG: SLATT domain-containing protein, partial [Nitrosomonadaceae bacterium]|nr:SLATT domain-containing protein [Nitrosomonadaceae bacterium]
MSGSRSVSPSKKDDKKEEKQEKRFLNGWSKEQEQLMSEWSDIALCYRWLHDNSEKIYHAKNLWINLPVIILTTLGGTASFGVQSVFSDPISKQYASFAIGSVSLFAGILTTVGNYLRYAQLEESNRVASIAWGKFQRLIAIELAMNPNERMDAIDFLKICRADLDRLIEQSPPIPTEAIYVFEAKFGAIKELKKPDICGALEHTTVFNSSDLRLKQVAVDAAILMRQRRQTLNELLAPQVQQTIEKKVDERLHLVLKNKEQQQTDAELDVMSPRETRRDSLSRDGTSRDGTSVRNRILARPNLHKKDFHTMQLKPYPDEPEKNVIVIPELHANPLMKANLLTSVPSVHSTPSLHPTAEIIIDVPEAPLLAEVES